MNVMKRVPNKVMLTLGQNAAPSVNETSQNVNVNFVTKTELCTGISYINSRSCPTVENTETDKGSVEYKDVESTTQVNDSFLLRRIEFKFSGFE